MAGTKIIQVRQPLQSDGVTLFQLTATCSVPGTLPDTSIFLRRVVDIDDPKEDTLERVCDVTDFTSYGTSREVAISEGSYLYRSTNVTVSYSDVATAAGAWEELSARINTLVTTYDTYVTAFLTPVEGTTTVYPTIDTSERTALIAEYSAALTAVAAAETARDTENIACDALQLELQCLQERLRDAQADVDSLGPIVGALSPIPAGITSGTSAATTYINTAEANNQASGASASEKSAILTNHNSASTNITAISQLNQALDANVHTPLVSHYATLQGRVASLQTEVTAAQEAVNDCALELATLQGTLDAARATRDSALAEIRAVCPDFDPSVDL